jgi:hypothetical protein
VTKRHIALVAFALWEAYWAYVFIAAPRPDERMETVFAFLMAVVVPLLLVVPVGLVLELRKTRKRKPAEKAE